METNAQELQFSQSHVDSSLEQETRTNLGSQVESDVPASEDDPLELLRALLLDHYRQRLRGLEKEANDAREKLSLLEYRFNDTDTLMATITPVIASSIQNKIRESPHEMVDALSPIIADAVKTSIAESREAMVEALYPITGQLVQRSVTEAMRDLARRIDEQMRTTFNFSLLLLRLRVLFGFAPSSESVLRELLPFEVEEIFLIHRQTGILLRHETKQIVLLTGEAAENLQVDNQLIGSMLTAIRDFADDVFGRSEEGQLKEVQYGEKLILLEAARYCYLAVVINGVEASGYRAQMRDTIFAIDNEYMRPLRNFTGDITLFAPTGKYLKTLYATNNTT